MALRSSRHRFFWRLCLLVGLFLLLVVGFYEYTYGRDNFRFKLPFDIHNHPWRDSDGSQSSDSHPFLPAHPIDDLIRAADDQFAALVQKEQSDVRGAANAYRKRRGRHPPPHFGDWVAFAKEKNARLIEDLYDQIYDDLEPFWAIEPEKLRDSVSDMEYVVTIRNKTLSTTGTHEGPMGIRLGVWKDMFERLEKRLPDIDIALNIMDQSRLLVPSKTISNYMQSAAMKGRQSRNGSWPSIADFKSRPPYDSHEYNHNWIDSGDLWELVRDTCSPGSDATRVEPISDFSQPPEFPFAYPEGTHEGYVANWTKARDPCFHPHLRGLHGAFVAPHRIKISNDLFPVFSGSKLTMNNDILLPPPIAWTEAELTSAEVEVHWWQQFAGGDGGPIKKPWESKKETAFWRGPATGGENKKETWTHFHRHRLLSMLNSTQVQLAERHAFPPKNFPLPHPDRPYEFHGSFNSTISAWISTFADGQFTDLMCYQKKPNQTTCDYTSEYYRVVPDPGTEKQFEYKYLPDVDGDASSPKFLSLLRNTSLPIKATIYKEWHDSRLIPWKHFVPMDNTFVDFWAIMDYFLAGRDAKAKKIAEEGSKWADTVLRQNDMLVYIYRLVLEYARVLDKDREVMGFIEDLRRR